jgi:hypothetical protein
MIEEEPPTTPEINTTIKKPSFIRDNQFLQQQKKSQSQYQ